MGYGIFIVFRIVCFNYFRICFYRCYRIYFLGLVYLSLLRFVSCCLSYLKVVSFRASSTFWIKNIFENSLFPRYLLFFSSSWFSSLSRLQPLFLIPLYFFFSCSLSSASSSSSILPNLLPLRSLFLIPLFPYLSSLLLLSSSPCYFPFSIYSPSHLGLLPPCYLLFLFYLLRRSKLPKDHPF